MLFLGSFERLHAGRFVDEVFRGENRGYFLGEVHDIDEQAAQEHDTLRSSVADVGEELHRAVGDIAYGVLIEVVAGVVAPVVASKLVVVHVVIISHIEGVIQEVVVPKIILVTASTDTDSPAILGEGILIVLHTGTVLPIDTYGIAIEGIAYQLGIIEFLKQ